MLLTDGSTLLISILCSIFRCNPRAWTLYKHTYDYDQQKEFWSQYETKHAVSALKLFAFQENC